MTIFTCSSVKIAEYWGRVTTVRSTHDRERVLLAVCVSWVWETKEKWTLSWFKCFIYLEIWHMIYQNVWIFIMNVAKPCNNQLDIRPFKEIGNCYLVLTASNLQLSPNSLSSVIGIILNYKYRCRLIIICFNITYYIRFFLLIK